MTNDPSEIQPASSQYMDLVDAALYEANRQLRREHFANLRTFYSAREAAIKLHEEEALPGFQFDNAVDVRLRAAVNTAGLFQNLTQAMIHIMWMIHDNQDWKIRGYESLYAWAKEEILPFFVDRYKDPEDYMSRLCNSVVGLLSDVAGQNVINPNTGEVTTAEDIIKNARISNIKEANYAYGKADPEQKQLLIVALAGGASNEVFDGLRRTIIHPQGNPKPDPIQIGLRDHDNGTHTVILDLTDNELVFLRSRLAGERFQWVFPETLGYQALDHYEVEAVGD